MIHLDLAHQGPYLSKLIALVRGARVSKQWPDLRSLQAGLAAMQPEAHGGAYPDLQIDPASGLPTWREWQRVRTDYDMASDALAELGDPAALAAGAERHGPGSPHHRRWARRRYLDGLLKGAPPPKDTLDVQLRRREGDEISVAMQMDKFDAGGLLVRLSVEVTVTVEAGHFDLSGDDLRPAEALQSMLYRASGLTAEATHLLLSALEGVTVDRVVRGAVGPARLDPMAPAEGHLELALDMTAFDLSADRHNDPDRAGEILSADRQSARRRLGYTVFTDRKFVATAGAAAALQARCEAAGTRNIIRRR